MFETKSEQFADIGLIEFEGNATNGDVLRAVEDYFPAYTEGNASTLRIEYQHPDSILLLTRKNPSRSSPITLNERFDPSFTKAILLHAGRKCLGLSTTLEDAETLSARYKEEEQERVSQAQERIRQAEEQAKEALSKFIKDAKFCSDLDFERTDHGQVKIRCDSHIPTLLPAAEILGKLQESIKACNVMQRTPKSTIENDTLIFEKGLSDDLIGTIEAYINPENPNILSFN